MQNSDQQKVPHAHIGIIASSCIVLIFVTFFFPLKAAAYSASSLARPTFSVSTGFNSRYRDSNWVPVLVSLRNDGTDFNGFVSINVPTPSSGVSKSSSVLTYQQAISLPSGSQKHVTLYVPISVGNQGSTQTISVDLLDANNQRVSSDVSTLRSVGPSDIFVGVLSDQATGFGPLSTVPLTDPTSSIVIEQLNASTFPTMTEVLKNFDLIVLDNFTTSNLKKDQLTSLQNWVSQGGSLIVVGGPDWRRTLSPLPPGLLPVSITGTATLPAKTPLLSIGGPTKGGPGKSTTPDIVQGMVTISTATSNANSTVALSSDTAPLLVQSKLGQGLVCYLAFDPTLEPVLNWSGAGALWQGLLLRALGDQMLVSGPSAGQTGSWRFAPGGSSSGGFSRLLQSTLPNMLPPMWLILALLLGYVAVLGPLRLLLVHLLKKRDWSWRIALSVIVIFSALSYTLALQQKGTSIVSSSISVLQLGQSATTSTNAHITTYVGVYVPNQGDFQVNIPGASLVQTFTDQSASTQGRPATILSTGQETDVKLQGVDMWTLRTLVSKHDRQVKGGLISHLILQDNSTLRGTVTNTLPYTLNNTYVLMDDHIKSLGDMAAGETKTVSLSLESTGNSSSQTTSLADQIAASNGLPVPYGMYYNSSQRTNILQRHMAQLATLSGENGYSYCGSTCFSNTAPLTTSNGVIVSSNATLASGSGPMTQITSRDPLLVPGAAATIIGWTDHFTDATDTIAVKGSRVAGTQEAFIQAPLDVSFADPLTQSVNVPPGMVVSQLIDVQSQGNNNAQTQSPGIYTLTAGSMTFEFALPQDFKLQSSSITLSELSNLTQGGIPIGPGISSITDANHIRIYLYNWQKHGWDRFAFNQFTLTINNAQAYIDTNGRILTQFANQDVTQGTAVFSKPSLQLRGQMSS